jgi:hypothetical protein
MAETISRLVRLEKIVGLKNPASTQPEERTIPIAIPFCRGWKTTMFHAESIGMVPAGQPKTYVLAPKYEIDARVYEERGYNHVPIIEIDARELEARRIADVALRCLQKSGIYQYVLGGDTIELAKLSSSR